MVEENNIIPQENSFIQKTSGHKPKTIKIMKIWSISSIAIILLLAGIVLIQMGESSSTVTIQTSEGSKINFIDESGQLSESLDIMGSEKVAENTVNFINDNLVQTGEASLVSVEEENGLYKVIVSYQGQEIPLHVSLDGSFLFQGSINMTEAAENKVDTPDTSTQPEQPAQPPETPKSDKPKVHGFVMSYCPYGLQFMKAYIPVLELLDGKADMSLDFVHYIMHGEKEIDENNRMYCVQKEYESKLPAYLRCFVGSDDWEGCFDETGIEKSKIDSCISDLDSTYNITGLYNDQSTWSGGKYPQYPVNADLTTQFAVRGSPSFVINGKTVSVNRAPEAIKQAICSAFNSPPSECEETLSTNAESPGIGPIGSGSGSTGDATCG